MWNRMDNAGLSAVHEIEKELNSKRRKSFEKQMTVSLTQQSDGLSDTVNDPINNLEMRLMQDDVNTVNTKEENEK